MRAARKKKLNFNNFDESVSLEMQTQAQLLKARLVQTLNKTNRSIKSNPELVLIGLCTTIHSKSTNRLSFAQIKY